MNLNSFAGKRWLELRIGYGTYLMFAIGLVNFITIQHGLIETINHIMPLWVFSIITISILIPACIVIGMVHQRKQAGTEAIYQTHANPYIYRVVPNSKESITMKMSLSNLEILKHLAEKTDADPLIISKIKSLQKDYQSLLDGSDSRDIVK